MMTFAKLNKIIEENHIPHDVKFMSDSGWECDATNMDGIFYNREKNEIIFTQSTMKYNYDGDLKNISYGDGYVALTHCLASWEK